MKEIERRFRLPIYPSSCPPKPPAKASLPRRSSIRPMPDITATQR
jgi:hypothetical protein